jgi:uncharacterized protein (DUF1697 family)
MVSMNRLTQFNLPNWRVTANSEAIEADYQLPVCGQVGITLGSSWQDMPQFFAFLRAINAGPKRAARMSVLRQTFESLGFFGVAPFLGSGNVVFETRAKDVRRLEKTIESELKQALGYSVPVFIRTHAELKAIVASKAFDKPLILDADVNIIFLAHSLDQKDRANLMALATETDRFRVHGREVYWWRRKKPGTSLFSNVPLAKVLSEPFTIRSTNTIRRLFAKWQ